MDCRKKGWLALLASVGSGLLLALSFPGVSVQSLAWVGFIPLLFALRGTTRRQAVFRGWLCGSVFYLISLFWLTFMAGTVEAFGFKAASWFSYLFLALYSALYFIPPALLVSVWDRRFGFEKKGFNFLFMFGLAAVWVAGEYFRSFFLTGFPWNPLGVSQYENLAVVQVAEFGGVYLVSALMVWLNAAVFVTATQYVDGLRLNKGYRPHPELLLGVAVVAVAASHGIRCLLRPFEVEDPVQVALVQPNIPQVAKWDDEQADLIYERLENLSDAAVHVEGVDLVIWPETALPDFLRVSHSSSRVVRETAAKGVPLLVGTMDVSFDGGHRSYFNSSMLFETNGLELTKYDKQHLVPFGEYVPFPGLLRKFTPVEADFIGGEESTIFEVREVAPFSALICFEDTIAPLASKAVRAGARWLVNQTNDAWFDPSCQSEQQLAHAVFRCLENRVPMARACNTGVTAVIGRYGRIQRGPEVRTAGFSSLELHPSPNGTEVGYTFYTQFGDLFAKSCLVISGLFAIFLRFTGKGRKNDDAG